jgi:ferredoxin
LAVILAATGTAFLICRYDPFVGFFRLSGNANIMVFGGCLLLIGLFVGRPYCRYLCPYGAILRVLSRFSRWHVRIPPEACINCRLCEDACPYDAIRSPTEPQTAEQRRFNRRLFLSLLGLAPLLVVLFAGLGTFLAGPLSRWHPEVRLAEQLRQEELGLTELTTDASDAYRSSGRPLSEAYQAAFTWREQYRWLGVWLGAWVGLVFGAKLVQLSIRRRQADYQPDRSGCVSCGRCFWYCPVEQVRLGLIREIPDDLPEKSS